MPRVSLFVLSMLLPPASLFAQTPQTCEGLRSLAVANAVVTTAAAVTGSFTPPGVSSPNATIGNLPAFCRVAITLKPTPDSEINTEIWLPMSGWNRKLQSVGNGAWAGRFHMRRWQRRSPAVTRPPVPTQGIQATPPASCPGIPNAWSITGIVPFTK